LGRGEKRKGGGGGGVWEGGRGVGGGGGTSGGRAEMYWVFFVLSLHVLTGEFIFTVCLEQAA